MIKKSKTIKAEIVTSKKITAKINAGIIHQKPNLKEYFLNGTDLVLVFTDGSQIIVDISEYIGGFDNEKIEAINNIQLLIENGELSISYDNEILNIDFSLQNKNLTVENNDENIDFNINKNGELEAIY